MPDLALTLCRVLSRAAIRCRVCKRLTLRGGYAAYPEGWCCSTRCLDQNVTLETLRMAQRSETL